MAGDVLVIRDEITHALSSSLRRGSNGLKVVPDLVHRAIAEGAWKRRKVDVYNGREVEFPSFVEYITTEPPEGLGATVDLIANMLRDRAEVLAEFRKATTAPVGVNRKDGDIVTIQPERGNSRAYTLDRLRRENVALFDRVVAGDLSAHRAAIEAGFRREPSALDRILRLLPKLTPVERDRLRAELAPPPKKRKGKK